MQGGALLVGEGGGIAPPDVAGTAERGAGLLLGAATRSTASLMILTAWNLWKVTAALGSCRRRP
jgi:hypothetical protein